MRSGLSPARARRAASRPLDSRPLHGFTLVELLVVIAIIGVLVALLLPAIQAAREAARRAQCQSNLHNLAIAVMNYEDSKKALPQSSDAPVVMSATGNPTVNLTHPDSSQLSWIVRILPFMEQQQLFSQFNLKKTFNVYKNENIATVPTPELSQPPLLLCPSDSAVGRLFKYGGRTSGASTGNRSFAKANYAAFASSEHVECQMLAPGTIMNEALALERVIDGTSNTIMLTEIRTRDDIEDVRGAWTVSWIGASVLGADVHAATSTLDKICAQPAGTPYSPSDKYGEYALMPNAPVPATATGARDNLDVCPNSAEADLIGMPCRIRNDTTASPRSMHVGGVLCAHVDGSTYWLTNEVDVITYGRLICSNDEQTVTQ